MHHTPLIWHSDHRQTPKCCLITTLCFFLYSPFHPIPKSSLFQMLRVEGERDICEASFPNFAIFLPSFSSASAFFTHFNNPQPWNLTFEVPGVKFLCGFACPSARLDADLSVCLPLSHSLSLLPLHPPPLLPLSHRSPPPSCLSSQWLHLVPASSPLRGFLCSLGCQVNSGMSGSFNTEDGARGWVGWPGSCFARCGFEIFVRYLMKCVDG